VAFIFALIVFMSGVGLELLLIDSFIVCAVELIFFLLSNPLIVLLCWLNLGKMSHVFAAEIRKLFDFISMTIKNNKL